METEVLLTLLALAAAAVLFVTGVVRVDVAAVLVTPAQALSGFSSSAVIAMLSVMVLGRGLDRTGVTVRIAHAIVGLAGTGERRLTAAVSLVAGGLSAFMQSVGATAVFVTPLASPTPASRSRRACYRGWSRWSSSGSSRSGRSTGPSTGGRSS